MNNKTALFHPPGVEPFNIPSSPPSFYNPSSANKHIDSLNSILTPNKACKPNKDYYAMYAPTNYSPLKVKVDKAIVDMDSKVVKVDDDAIKMLNGEHALKQVKPKTSVNKHENCFPKTTVKPDANCDLIPTKDNDLSNGTTFVNNKHISNTVIKDCFSTSKSNNTMPLSANDNIQILLNRFRYGKPTHRVQRKMVTKVDKNVLLNKHGSATKKDDSKTSVVSDLDGTNTSMFQTESDHSIYGDFDINNLQQKVDLLLSEKHSNDTMASLDEKENMLSRKKLPSLKGGPSHSGYLSKKYTKASSESSLTSPCTIPKELVTPTNDDAHNNSERLNTALEQIPLTKVQPNDIRIDISKQDDILYQWRLRRKLESAHGKIASNYAQNVVNTPSLVNKQTNETYSCMKNSVPEKSNDCVCLANNVFAQQTVLPNYGSTKDAGIHVVPNLSVETQTGNSLELESSVNDNVKINQSVDCSSLKSIDKPKSSSAEADIILLSSDTHSTPPKDVNEADGISATGVVKNIIVNRLFDSHESQDFELSHTSLSSNTSYLVDNSNNPTNTHVMLEQMPTCNEVPDHEDINVSLKNESNNSTSSENLDVYEHLFERITNDENSYPDDPVLKSLRTLRQNLLSRLQLINDENKVA